MFTIKEGYRNDDVGLPLAVVALVAFILVAVLTFALWRLDESRCRVGAATEVARTGVTFIDNEKGSDC